MTIRDFVEKTGTDYQEMANAVFHSHLHRRGKNIDYDTEELRAVALSHLTKKEKRLDSVLQRTRREIKNIQERIRRTEA